MKKILKHFVLILILFTTLNTVYAASSDFTPPTIPKPATLPGPAKNDPVSNENYLTNELIPRVVRGALGILGVGSLFFVILGGVQYLITFQDEANAENAKKTIQYAIYGLIIAIFSYSIVNIISYIDGINATQDTNIKTIKSCGTGYIYDAEHDLCKQEQ